MGWFSKLFSSSPKATPNAFNNPELARVVVQATPKASKSLLLDDDFEPLWWKNGVEIPQPYPDIQSRAQNLPAIAPHVRSKVGKVLEGRFQISQDTSKILEAIQNPNAQVADIAALVTRDPMLVSLVLKVVNSAQYGLGNRIASIHQALSLLGFATLRQLVVSQMVQPLAKNPEDQALFRKVWTHDAMASTCAYQLARKLPRIQNKPEIQAEILTIGLVQHIGKILLKPQECGVLATQTGLPESVVEGNAASCFTESWGMPPRMGKVLEIAPMAFRIPVIQIPEDIRATTLLVAFASFVTRTYGYEDGAIIELPPSSCLEYLGWNPPADRHWIPREIAREMEKARVAMESGLT